MPFAEGKVEVVSIKPLQNPDNYGNTFRASIKLGEDWFTYGSLKKDVINIKKGNDWVQLQKGMEVEFSYQENGNFKNIKKSSFEITNVEVGEVPQKNVPHSTPKKGQVKQSTYSNVNPAEIGQCMNLAVEVLDFKGADMLDPESAVAAIQWYKRSRQLFSSLYPTVDLEAKLPEKKPKAKTEDKQAPPFEEDELDLDEDI